MRKQIPRTEAFQDAFQDALDSERTLLLHARKQLSSLVETGKDVLVPLEQGLAQMIKTQNTFHMDRTGNAHKFLASMAECEFKATEFCKQCTATMKPLERQVSEATDHTIVQMKSREKELYHQ